MKSFLKKYLPFKIILKIISKKNKINKYKVCYSDSLINENVKITISIINSLKELHIDLPKEIHIDKENGKRLKHCLQLWLPQILSLQEKELSRFSITLNASDLGEENILSMDSINERNLIPDEFSMEDYSKGYSARDDLGGGVVLTCIHEIDYLYWFFGQVQEVFSITGKFSNLKIQSSDLSAIIMKFQNNIIAEIHLDYFQKPETRSCKIIGTKGTIVWNSKTNDVKLYNLKNEKWSTKLKIKNYKKNDMYKKELAHFIQCIKQKKKSQNDLSQGNYVLKIALGIIKSSKLKKIITIEKN